MPTLAADLRALSTLTLLVCLGWGSIARAQDPTRTNDFQSLREQGIHYYRQSHGRMWKPALEFLQKAAATPEGEEDWKTQYWLGKISNENSILEVAFPAAQLSLQLATRESQEKKSKALVKYLERSFAGVTFTQDERQKKTLQEGYIVLDVDKPLISRKKKAVFEAIKKRFAETRLKPPTTLFLPFGEYRANGAPFKIVKGQEAKAVLFLFAEQGEGEGLSWPWMAGIGLGAAAVVAGVSALLFVTDDHQTFEIRSVVVEQ